MASETILIQDATPNVLRRPNRVIPKTLKRKHPLLGNALVASPRSHAQLNSSHLLPQSIRMNSSIIKQDLARLAAIAFGCWVGIAALPLLADSNREQTKTKANGATEITQSLNERFADANSKEIPDFQKHVIPLLGRLGCNGRACHGSFQGRGGFQLSLFGYDFTADHEAMLEESSGRVDREDIDESLILAKPLDADIHEGGKRFDEGSWQHHVLRRWIESGANNDSKVPQQLTRLEVIPAEIQFKGEGEAVDLQAIAHWEDGSVEDVTVLCRFSSNDDSIASIDESGHVESGAQGDTHVVIYYDNAVIPVPVLRPFAEHVVSDRELPNHPVDRLIDQKLGKLGIQPSGLCTDAEFIRRVSLDLTGILPSAEQVREFLADTREDKREQLTEDLLQASGYAAWWA